MQTINHTFTDLLKWKCNYMPKPEEIALKVLSDDENDESLTEEGTIESPIESLTIQIARIIQTAQNDEVLIQSSSAPEATAANTPFQACNIASYKAAIALLSQHLENNAEITIEELKSIWQNYQETVNETALDLTESPSAYANVLFLKCYAVLRPSESVADFIKFFFDKDNAAVLLAQFDDSTETVTFTSKEIASDFNSDELRQLYDRDTVTSVEDCQAMLHNLVRDGKNLLPLSRTLEQLAQKPSAHITLQQSYPRLAQAMKAKSAFLSEYLSAV